MITFILVFLVLLACNAVILGGAMALASWLGWLPGVEWPWTECVAKLKQGEL